MSVSYVHRNEQETTKKAPYLHWEYDQVVQVYSFA